VPLLAVAAAVPAAKVMSRRRHACLYSSNYGRGCGVGRAVGVGGTLGAGVGVAVGLAVELGVGPYGHHRIRVSLAVVHTRADDDAVFANSICRRGSFHRQIPARVRGDEIGKAIGVCSVIKKRKRYGMCANW